MSYAKPEVTLLGDAEALIQGNKQPPNIADNAKVETAAYDPEED